MFMSLKTEADILPITDKKLNRNGRCHVGLTHHTEMKTSCPQHETFNHKLYKTSSVFQNFLETTPYNPTAVITNTSMYGCFNNTFMHLILDAPNLDMQDPSSLSLPPYSLSFHTIP